MVEDSWNYILIDSDTPEPEYELNKMTVEKQLFHIAVQYIHIYTTIPEGQGRNDKMNYRFHPLEGKFILSALHVLYVDITPVWKNGQLTM